MHDKARHVNIIIPLSVSLPLGACPSSYLLSPSPVPPAPVGTYLYSTAAPLQHDTICCSCCSTVGTAVLYIAIGTHYTNRLTALLKPYGAVRLLRSLKPTRKAAGATTTSTTADPIGRASHPISSHLHLQSPSPSPSPSHLCPTASIASCGILPPLPRPIPPLGQGCR